MARFIGIHFVPVLLCDGVRLYDVPGGKMVHPNRHGTNPLSWPTSATFRSGRDLGWLLLGHAAERLDDRLRLADGIRAPKEDRFLALERCDRSE
jgi:hypothetical protein